jgi:HD-like signal output (HDOD) protein
VKSAIERVHSIFQYLPEENLKTIIGHIQVLPTLPDIYLQMTSELEKPEPSIDRIKKIISQDVAMSAKLLQVVNSAFFGLRQALTNPGQAVTMLGLNLVKSIVLMLHVFHEQEMIRFNGLTLNSLWRHSLSVAQNARDLAMHEGMSSAMIEHVGSAALFHDIGKLILMANLPAEYEKVYKKVRAERCVMSDVEIELLGASHGQVGAYLLGLWGFDDMYVNVCRFHHSPALSGETEIGAVCLVHAADVFDYIMEPDESGEKPLTLDESYLSGVGSAERVAAWKRLILKDNPVIE